MVFLFLLGFLRKTTNVKHKSVILLTYLFMVQYLHRKHLLLFCFAIFFFFSFSILSFPRIFLLFFFFLWAKLINLMRRKFSKSAVFDRLYKSSGIKIIRKGKRKKNLFKQLLTITEV